MKDGGSDFRVHAHLLKLFRRERTWFGENVIRDRELADIVQQRRSLDSLYLGFRHPKRSRKACCVRLNALDVAGLGLILRIDRKRERLDRREMKLGYLLCLTALPLDSAPTGTEREVNRSSRWQREPDGWRRQHRRGDGRTCRRKCAARIHTDGERPLTHSHTCRSVSCVIATRVSPGAK